MIFWIKIALEINKFYLLVLLSGVASGWHGWTTCMSKGPRPKGAPRDWEEKQEYRKKRKKRKERKRERQTDTFQIWHIWPSFSRIGWTYIWNSQEITDHGKLPHRFWPKTGAYIYGKVIFNSLLLYSKLITQKYLWILIDGLTELGESTISGFTIWYAHTVTTVGVAPWKTGGWGLSSKHNWAVHFTVYGEVQGAHYRHWGPMYLAICDFSENGN